MRDWIVGQDPRDVERVMRRIWVRGFKPFGSAVIVRWRVSDDIAAGHSCRATARILGVSPSTAFRLAAWFRDHGSIAPKLQGCGPGTAGKLAPHVVFLAEIVAG